MIRPVTAHFWVLGTGDICSYGDVKDLRILRYAQDDNQEIKHVKERSQTI